MEKSSFWDKVKNIFSWLRSLFFNKELELSVVGLQNAGKTTFVNVLANYKFDEDTIPTIGFNFRTIKKGKVQFKLWDLGGQPRFRDSWEKYCRTSDVIIYVVDSADIGNLDVAKLQLHQLLAWPSLEGLPLVVLGNKNDIDGALSETDIANSMDLNSIKDRTVTVYSVSCKNMVNIDKVLKLLTNFNKKSK